MAPALALRTPWYVLERAAVPVPLTDPSARRPAIQKYDTPEFARQLIADPRASLSFDPDEDVWSFPVPIGAFGSGVGRERFATSRLVYTPMRKLYQPSHDRFYAVTVELFCDEPGLPRPGDLTGVELRFVLRRERVVVHGDSSAARRLARDLAVELDAERRPTGAVSSVPDTDDVDDVLWVERTEQRAFTAAQLTQLAAIQPELVVEAWTLDAAGRGGWTRIEDAADPELAPGEREFSMWRLPASAEDCAAARTRSLWFGIVPASSGDPDADGRAMLDDRSSYRIRCFARRQPPAGLPQCPPRLWWSEPTAAFRLASFYDPQGTKNRRVSITMPDFRTLAARAGQPPGPGGVEIVRPPGSQLRFESDRGRPVNESTTDFGAQTSRCTFALELLMIVAMFLFSLFLPVVVFIFQLWWLLLLRFCFPRPDLALQVLGVHLSSGGTLGVLPQTAPPPADPADPPLPDLDMLDEVLEAPGAAAQVLALDPDLASRSDLGVALLEDLDSDLVDTEPDPTPEPVPDDPLCP
jgi:hypothetical protein